MEIIKEKELNNIISELEAIGFQKEETENDLILEYDRDYHILSKTKLSYRQLFNMLIMIGENKVKSQLQTIIDN